MEDEDSQSLKVFVEQSGMQDFSIKNENQLDRLFHAINKNNISTLRIKSIDKNLYKKLFLHLKNNKILKCFDFDYTCNDMHFIKYLSQVINTMQLDTLHLNYLYEEAPREDDTNEKRNNAIITLWKSLEKNQTLNTLIVGSWSTYPEKSEHTQAIISTLRKNKNITGISFEHRDFTQVCTGPEGDVQKKIKILINKNNARQSLKKLIEKVFH